ncbi:hypothetical protein F5146DRAFT_936137 [Armillaria mellea]|nr:hypothetical protein F5146DRAFT_936137 [Armillaria mellea]
MIALCQAKCMILQLKEEDGAINLPTTQHGLKGNVIIYPQRPSDIMSMLPPSLEEITSPICILFVGLQAPSQDWLRNHAKLLAVNGSCVCKALAWLKANNPYYRDIELNEPILTYLDTNPVLPFSVQHIPLSTSAETLTDRYEPPVHTTRLGCLHETLLKPEDIPWESVVITDVNMDISSNRLKAATLKHVKTNGGGYIEVCHDPIPVNEFNNPALFPLMYLTLFPYGVGGLEDHGRLNPLAFNSHVKHLLQLNDHRFQKHCIFLFTAFNMIQRQKLLLQMSFRVKRKDFLLQFSAYLILLGAYHLSYHSKHPHHAFTEPTTARLLCLANTGHLPHVPWTLLLFLDMTRTLYK